MAEFKGFSEASLLYADNHHVVEHLEKLFKQEERRLFSELEDALSEKQGLTDWTFDSGQGWLSLRFPAGKERDAILRIDMYLGPGGVGLGEEDRKRHFWADLKTGAAIRDVRKFKSGFQKLAEKELVSGTFSKDERKELAYKNKFLIRREVEFENEKVLDTMLAEIQRLQKFARYAEQAFKK